MADGVLEELPPEVAPPEAEPELDLEGSELGAGAELPPEGELDEDELDPELDGGVDGVVALPLVLPLVLPLLGDLVLPLSWPQAARPKAMATATARVESFMYSSMVGMSRESSKERAGSKPLNSQGQYPARCTHCLLRGISYLLPEGLEPGELERLDESCEPPGVRPMLPLEPDEPLLPVADEPPEAPPLPS
ncbi:MAG: hypothetical protein ACREUN_00095 [Burkholderiales bacterium]